MPPTVKGKTTGRNLSKATTRSSNVPAKKNQSSRLDKPQDLPPATIIYGIGASLIFIDSFFLLMAWHLFTGIVTFFIGGCLAGLALHHLKFK